MQIDIREEIIFKVSRQEFRLIGLGLSGNLTKPKDRETARELNLRLLEARTKLLEELKELAEGTLRKMAQEDVAEKVREAMEGDDGEPVQAG
jgi:hypothetical protein